MPWKATDAMKEGEWPSRMQEGNWRPVLTLLDADTRYLLRAEPMLENLLEQRRVIAGAHRALGWLSPGGQPCLDLRCQRGPSRAYGTALARQRIAGSRPRAAAGRHR